jgi:hypothetical protein
MANGHAQSSDHAHLIFKSVPPLLKLGKHRWFNDYNSSIKEHCYQYRMTQEALTGLTEVKFENCIFWLDLKGKFTMCDNREFFYISSTECYSVGTCCI